MTEVDEEELAQVIDAIVSHATTLSEDPKIVISALLAAGIAMLQQANIPAQALESLGVLFLDELRKK